jgi:hypothetical protein
MKEYLTAGVALIIISLGNFAYIVARVSSYPETALIFRTSLQWLVLQFGASLFCGVLGGYFLAIHTERQKALSQQPLSQDCSVQE